MTLDEAIEHAEERACGNDQCAKDHAQLADWLRELRRARMEIDLLKTLRDGFQADAQEYKDENAKLRDAMYTNAGKHALQHMDEDELRIWATQQSEYIDQLKELVRDMWRFTGASCKKYPRLFDPAAAGGQTVQLNALDAIEQRMRELGIEAYE